MINNDEKHDICVEVLYEYLNAFQVSERAMRKSPGPMTRKEKTELVYYQEMVRNISMVIDYVENKTESINYDWNA